jgi:MFS family permease
MQKNESLQLPSFRHYLALRFALILSLNWQTAVVSYMIYELTRNTVQGPALFLGLMGLAEVVPAVLGSLLAGPYVDRSEKRGLLLFCVVGYLVLSLYFVGLSWPVLQDKIGLSWTLGLLYTGIFLGGLARAFWSPSAFSLVGLLVPRPLLPNATTWSSMSWQAGAVLGPLAGGLFLAPLGYEASLLSVTALQIVAVVFALAIPKQPVAEAKRESVFKSVGEGLEFVFKNQLVLTALSLDMFAVLFGGATALLPVYANDILGVGEVGYGWLKAAPGLGSVITLIILSWLPLKNRPGIKLLCSVAGFGICTIVFGISTSFILSVVTLVLLGIFDGVSVVIRGIILQLKTPHEMRGRVAAVNTMFVSSSNEIGSLESGLTAKWMGTVPSVVVGGVLTLVVVAVAAFRAPKLRTLNFSTEAEEEKKEVELG